MKLYQAIVNNESALNNPIFADDAEERQERIVDLLPSGSGFDAGTKIESVSDSKITLSTAFHHMDENGFYCGWTEHNVIITASLLHGFNVRVTGQNKRDIKDYIADVFHDIMSTDFEWLNKEGV